jgi:alpha-mannosidase
MKLQFFAAWIILILSITAHGQTSQDNYFQGYEKEISGMRFGYHSPLPDVKNSLLIRGQENYDPIVWEAEAIPKNYKEPYVTYLWIFGMDVTANPAHFHLSVNKVPYVSFSSSKKSNIGPITFKGKDGSELTLNVTMLDNAGDQMGFAILKIPLKADRVGRGITSPPSNVVELRENLRYFLSTCRGEF